MLYNRACAKWEFEWEPPIIHVTRMIFSGSRRGASKWTTAGTKSLAPDEDASVRDDLEAGIGAASAAAIANGVVTETHTEA